MTKKTERLLRELGSLFARYSLNDWEPVLKELSAGGRHDGLVRAIELHLKQATARAVAKRAAKKKVPAKRGAPRKRKASAALDLFREAANARRILPSAHDLRMASEMIGMKADLPSDRREAVRRLVSHLEELPDELVTVLLEKLARAQRSAQPDQGEEFHRWANLIMGRRSI